MSRQFTLEKFLSHAPLPLLRQWLAERGVGDDLDWNDLEDDASPVCTAIRAAPEQTQDLIHTALEDVFYHADEGCVRTIINAAREARPPEDLAPRFASMSGDVERVLWTFLHRPAIYEASVRLEEAEGLPFKKRADLPELECFFESHGADALRAELCALFTRLEGRGERCVIHTLVSSGQFYYFCCLEDRAQRYQEFDENSRLKTRTRRSTFDVILIYNPEACSLETFTRGGMKVRSEVERCFGKAVLGSELKDAPRYGMIYDLEPLLSREFVFTLEPAGLIEGVRLRELKLEYTNASRNAITFSVPAAAPKDAIYDLLEDTLGIDGLTDILRPMRAKLTASFTAPDGKMRTRTFQITHPCSCNLHGGTVDERLKALLKVWRLDVS